jgi:hypothetical protein
MNKLLGPRQIKTRAERVSWNLSSDPRAGTKTLTVRIVFRMLRATISFTAPAREGQNGTDVLCGPVKVSWKVERTADVVSRLRQMLLQTADQFRQRQPDE